MNPLLIPEIFKIICQHFKNVKQLLRMQELSTIHKKIIKNEYWNNFKLKITDDVYKFNYIIDNYHFLNINIKFTQTILFDDMSEEDDYVTLQIRCEKMTDINIKKIKRQINTFLNNSADCQY